MQVHAVHMFVWFIRTTGECRDIVHCNGVPLLWGTLELFVVHVNLWKRSQRSAKVACRTFGKCTSGALSVYGKCTSGALSPFGLPFLRVCSLLCFVSLLYLAHSMVTASAVIIAVFYLDLRKSDAGAVPLLQHL